MQRRIRDVGWFDRNDPSVAHALDRAGPALPAVPVKVNCVFVDDLGRPVALRCATVAVV